MKSQEWSFLDKSQWGNGPWVYEPDKAQWPDKETGLPCLAVRHPNSGHWCGYVGVAEGHPEFGKDYDAVLADVHGGLTFADFCNPNEKEQGVCHIPDEGEPDRVYWLGFDCVHLGDLSPAYNRRLGQVDAYPDTYRTLDYIKNECASLARQLKETNSSNTL